MAPLAPDAELRGRASELFAGSAAYVLRPVPFSAGDDLAAIDAKLAYLVAQLRAWLGEAGDGVQARDVLLVSHLLSDAHTLRWDVRSRHVEERQQRFAQLDRGLVEMRRERDPDALLDSIPRFVIDCCGFDRVLVSRVEGDAWLPWRSLAREVRPEEQTFATWLSEAPRIQLDPRIREGEIVDRRQAVLVFPDDEEGRVSRPFTRARDGTSGDEGAGSYVAVPLAPSDDVVGLIHADYVEREVTQLDKEILAAFAKAFDYTYERAVLIWQMADERTRIAAALEQVKSVLLDVESTEMVLRRRANKVRRQPDAALSLPERSEATKELAHILTAREMEVLAAMSTGATNVRIAHELSISRDTVKSHVTSILRKLGAENRSEAIAHYIRLTIGSL